MRSIQKTNKMTPTRGLKVESMHLPLTPKAAVLFWSFLPLFSSVSTVQHIETKVEILFAWTFSMP
jgi:hypothetical protein